VVVAHSALPRTGNGKLDRRALPDPEWPVDSAPGSSSAQSAQPAAEPESDATPGIAEAIRGVWQDVLGVDTVGPEDDFLALGGDSVRAIQIANRLTSRLGITISPDAILESPTLAELCARIEVLRGA
jgi:acyl carrier protein